MKALPLVSMNLDATGRGSLLVDGVAMSGSVVAVDVAAGRNKITRVTLEIHGGFAMPEQPAEVLMRVTGMDDAYQALGAAASEADDGSVARGFFAARAVLSWLAASDRKTTLIQHVTDVLKAP